MSVTFNLRRNALFHDGQPVTSEDVAFSTMLKAVDRVETPAHHSTSLRFRCPTSGWHAVRC
ncbi:MAG: hypothetical protein HQL53_02355 [Magnetococcales bacterium]|nr:hypothetical protein [Magnetococcales bacterium]